jgi:hypothetical protein
MGIIQHVMDDEQARTPMSPPGEPRATWELGEKALTIARILKSCLPLLGDKAGYPSVAHRRLDETAIRSKAECVVMSLDARLDAAADHYATTAGVQAAKRAIGHEFGQDRFPEAELADCIRVALGAREAALEQYWRERKAAGR